MLDTPWMRELSVAEQRYQAVLAVISDGLLISQVASKVGVSRQTLHSWLARMRPRAGRGCCIGRIGRLVGLIRSRRREIAERADRRWKSARDLYGDVANPTREPR